MNTLSKVQQLLMQDQESQDTGYNARSFLEEKTLDDPTYVSQLRNQMTHAEGYITNRMSQTFDSHLKLSILLAQPYSLNAEPQAYLQTYLKVRYNVSDEQLTRLIEALVYHRWYRNASIILIENCNSDKELITQSLKLLDYISQIRDFPEIDVHDFFVNFQHHSCFDELLKRYLETGQGSTIATNFAELKRIVLYGRKLQKSHQNFSKYDCLEDYSLSLLISGDYPSYIKLRALYSKIEFIRSKFHSRSAALLEIKSISREIEAFKDISGVMATIISIIQPRYAIEITTISELLRKMKLDIFDLNLLLSYNLPLSEVKRLYKYHEGLKKYDLRFLTTITDIFIRYGETDLILQILKKYRQVLPSFHQAKILKYFKNDRLRFSPVLRMIPPYKKGYVLNTLAIELCNDFTEHRDNVTMISFEEIFWFVDKMKLLKMDTVPFLNPIFDKILTDDRFISANGNSYGDSFVRFSAKSRVNLEMLNAWNQKLFTLYSSSPNPEFLNLEYNRRIVLRMVRMHATSRREELLKVFGRNLSILPIEAAIHLVNDVLNNFKEDRGRNVSTEAFVSSLMSKILLCFIDSYLRKMSFSQEGFQDLSLFIQDVGFLGNDALTVLLRSPLKHKLMQRLLERHPDLAEEIILDENDNSFIKGYLIGVVQTERLSPSHKVKLLNATIYAKFKLRNQFFLGQKFSIIFCQYVVDRLTEGECNELVNLERFLWGLRHCKRNKVPARFYKSWFKQLNSMKMITN